MPAQSAKKSTKKASVTSKDTTDMLRKQRNFLAGAVVLAAALVAISLGFLGYNRQGLSHSYRTRVPVVQKGQGVLFLDSSNTGDLKAGDTVTVTVNENSGHEPINAVQAAITYPGNKMKVVKVTNSSAFPTEAATDTSSVNLVRVARGVESQKKSVTGAHQVVTIEFSVVKDEAPLEVKVDQDFSLLVRSTDNKNILSSAKSE